MKSTKRWREIRVQESCLKVKQKIVFMVSLIFLRYRENLSWGVFSFFPGNQLLLGSKDNNKPLERRRRWNYKGFYSLPHHEVKRKNNLVYDTELLTLMSQSTNTKNLSHLGQRQPIQPCNWILHKFVYWFLPEKRLDAKNECWMAVLCERKNIAVSLRTPENRMSLFVSQAI